MVLGRKLISGFFFGFFLLGSGTGFGGQGVREMRWAADGVFFWCV